MKKLTSVMFIVAILMQVSLVGVVEGVRKVNKSLYAGKKGDLYFALERVNNKNIDFWKQYIGAQRAKLDPEKIKNDIDSLDYALDVAMESFLNSLGHVGGDHVWIAYALLKPVQKKAYQTPLGLSDDIEMAVTVMTNGTVPFTTHLGIFRAAEFFKKDKKKHSNLSIDLHSFAAKAALKAYGNKLYMITKPMDTMRNIMLKKVPSKAVCWGDSVDFDLFEKLKKRIDLFKEALVFAQTDPKKIDWDKYESYFSGVGIDCQDCEKYRIRALYAMNRYIKKHEQDITSKFNLLFPQGDSDRMQCLKITETKNKIFMALPDSGGKLLKFEMPKFYNTDDLFKLKGLLTVIIKLDVLAGMFDLEKI